MNREEVRARLAALARSGKLTAEEVVEDARRETSPLHDLFEWDDAEAAQRWRVEQARVLIRSVRVEVEVRDVKVSVPAYVRDVRAEPGEQGYRAVAQVRDDRALAKETLLYEFERCLAGVERVRHLASFFRLEGDVEKFREALDEIMTRVRRAA